MTPKEKAKELQKQYIVIIHEVHDYRLELYDLMEAVKRCALIAVDEMIKQHKKITVSHYITCYKTYQDFNNNFENIQHQLDSNVINNVGYWTEVKQEIEKL